MISPKSVRDILDAVKVEDIVQEFVALRRRGSSLVGRCPFHQEKTASFHVTPSRNIFKCFGCGKGGNAVQFLMEHERFSFPEALRYIAQKYRIEIEETQYSPEYIIQQQQAESLYILNQFAQQFFRDEMMQSDRGRSIGLNYFKERGFSEETIEKFGLGYAPDSGDALLRAAKAVGYTEEQLRKTGLIKEADHTRQLGSRDFFRDRVIFPIYSQSGKVIAFAGRIMGSNPKAPKYINSPETEIYLKSKVLFGVFQARKAIRTKDECILVEGYTDVISLHQGGIENVVASSGTALTPDQLGLIRRNTAQLKILYDGDPAGIKAALRGLDLALEQDLNVQIVLLPEGEDPDSYMRKAGSSEFTRYLQNQAQDFILFKAGLLMQEAGTDPVKRSAVIKDIVGSIAKIPDPLKRAIFVQECARVVKVEEATLMSETNRLVSAHLQKKRSGEPAGSVTDGSELQPVPSDPAAGSDSATPPSVIAGDEFQEKDIARVLIAFGAEEFDAEEHISVAEFVIGHIEDVLEEFENPLYARIVRETMDCLINQRSRYNIHYFLQHDDRDISKLAVDLLSEPYEYSPNWSLMWNIELRTQKMPGENFQADSIQALKRFMLRKLGRRISNTTVQLGEAYTRQDEEGSRRAVQALMRLKQIHDQVATELGMVVVQ
jgi:DNA primase